MRTKPFNTPDVQAILAGRKTMFREVAKMKLYSKRTWLNKPKSPSLGSVTAFDGEVIYSEGSERTTFLAISDCNKTIKLIKNTESIEDFIGKMALLKSEIELFINHLKGTL